jgi:hypothetical protein
MWRDHVQTAKRIEEETDLLKNQLLARCVDLGSRIQTSHGIIQVSKPGEVNRTDYKALAQDLANRLQLRGEAFDFEAELAKRTTTSPSDGSLRRPTNWTKKETK